MPEVFHSKAEANEAKKAEPHPVTIMNQKPGKPGLFSAFYPLPEQTSFATQEPNEIIILLLRRHFVTNLPWLLIATFFALIGSFFPAFLRSESFSTVIFLSDQFIFILTALYFLVIIGFVLTQFATWFYQLGLITNARVIDVDFTSLLSRKIAYTELEDIVDVEVVQSGIFQSIFTYGTVAIQTEGHKPNFEFTRIPKPNEVADTLSDLLRERKRND